MKNKTIQKSLGDRDVCADARINIYAGQRTGSRWLETEQNRLVVGGG